MRMSKLKALWTYNAATFAVTATILVVIGVTRPSITSAPAAASVPSPPVQSAPTVNDEPIAALVTAPSLTDLGIGPSALWTRASDENKALFAQTGIALIDQQRNIGMEPKGQRVVAAWLTQCLDREAPIHPDEKLINQMQACMQSMTPQDAAEIAAATSALRERE